MYVYIYMCVCVCMSNIYMYWEFSTVHLLANLVKSLELGHWYIVRYIYTNIYWFREKKQSVAPSYGFDPLPGLLDKHGHEELSQ